METTHKKNLSTDSTPSFSLADLEFLQKLSQNPFGEVWTVTSQSQPLTLKKISKSKLQKIQTQFTREINKWHKIHHKSLIQIISSCEDSDYLYILTEQITGIPLSKKLLTEKCLDKSTAICILTQVIDTIEYLHSLHPPVMYKNIRPENILVELDGTVKLSDFCGASVNEEDFAGSTLEYLAPEMFGRSEFGISIDVWCIGVLIYEMMFGKSPFKKSSTASVLADIQKCNVFYPEAADQSLKDLISKILVRDPAKRLSLDKIKTHKWFVKKIINAKDFYEVTVKCLKSEIEEKKGENEELSRKICEVGQKIEEFLQKCEVLEGRIEEKKRDLGGLEKENEQVEIELKSLENEEDENLDLVVEKVEILKRELNVFMRKQEILTEVKEFKQKSFEFIESKYKSSESLLKLLNERYKLITTPSLMMANILVFTIPQIDVELFNTLSGPVNAEFSQSCESLLTKVQDMSNVIYLKERYICELSVLYQKKQAELLKCYEDEKNGIEAKTQRNRFECANILKCYAEETADKELRKLEFGCINVKVEDLEEKRERFDELERKYKETLRKVQIAKREIMKLKIKKHRRGLDMKSKIDTLSNLTEAMLQAKVDLDVHKVKRIT